MKHTYTEKQIYKWFCEQADIILNLFDFSEEARVIKQKDLAQRLMYKLKNKLSETKTLTTTTSSLPYLQELCAIKYNLEHCNAVMSMISIRTILSQTSFLSCPIKESIILNI